NIIVSSSTAPGGSGNCSYTDFKIHASDTDPNATTVVNINSLQMGTCTRLTVLGVGKVDLRIGAPTGVGLYVGGDIPTAAHFGVDQNDKWNAPSPLPGGQLTVWINSSNMTCSNSGGIPTPSCAGMISHATGSATIFTPNGSFNYDDSLGSLGYSFNGPLVANKILLTGYNKINVGAGTNFMYGTFNKLRSWKDQ
ncbi:MAG TPA: hypothetical protein VEW91_00645, partial [bacterium]|nr:hypothetical protein [bacterium]